MTLRFLSLLFILLSYWTFAQRHTRSKQVHIINLEAPQLRTNKTIWIYLPKNYLLTPKKYPVLYMHDAQNLFDAQTSFGGEWNVDEKLDSLQAPIIVVGIEHGNEKRLDELTPFINSKYGGGNGDNYLDFIVNSLKPYIDSQYRTKTNAKNTGIMGSSLGGLVSYYALFRYPKVFGKAGIFSPSFWFNRKEIIEISQKSPKIKTKIYFLCGANEGDATDKRTSVSDLNTIYDILSEKNGNCNTLIQKKIVPEGLHNENLWRDAFVPAYIWLFK
jgi:predicted alpha/beta superfamily hydrolase